MADMSAFLACIRYNNGMTMCLSCKRTVKVNLSIIEKKVESRQTRGSLLEKFGHRGGGIFTYDPSDGTLCTTCCGIVCGECSETSSDCPICGRELHWIGELLA